MIGGGVGKRYARAIYQLAEEQKVVETVGKDLTDLAATWESSEELSDTFENPKLSVEVKRALALALAEKAGAHPILKNAVQMLSDRGRMRYLADIAETFHRIHELGAGRVRAEIVTATSLPDAYYAQLEKTLKQATGKEVVLVRRVDPSLIGGVVTTVGGRVFDGSLKNRLRHLRAQLLSTTD